MLTGKAEQKAKAKYLKRFMKTNPNEYELKSWHRGWNNLAVMEEYKKRKARRMK